MDLPQQVVTDLTHAGRTVVERGLVLGSGGNLSARLDADTFVVTATGTWLDELAPRDFAVVSVEHGPEGAGPRPSVEWRLHQMTYAVRPDVRAVVHLHPQHVLLIDALGAPLRLLTSDHQMYVGAPARVPFLPAGSTEVAEAAADAARGCDTIVLAHHGCSALGDSVRMALRRAMNLEEAAMMTYRLLLAGDTEADFPQEWKGRVLGA